ncbi:unnamed protein product, partial [Iphiclides podalirius]
MLVPRVLLLLVFSHHGEVASVPQTRIGKRSLVGKASFVTVHNAIVPVVRRQKGPLSPVPILKHGIVVPNLHVIPISSVHRIHGGDSQILSHTITHSANVTGQTGLVSVLIPIHNLVPVHDLTVIPLHKEPKISFRLSNERDEPVNRYRHPLGGYGAGWYYGGHGAGHGFHYSYG